MREDNSFRACGVITCQSVFIQPSEQSQGSALRHCPHPAAGDAEKLLVRLVTRLEDGNPLGTETKQHLSPVSYCLVSVA